MKSENFTMIQNALQYEEGMEKIMHLSDCFKQLCLLLFPTVNAVKAINQTCSKYPELHVVSGYFKAHFKLRQEKASGDFSYLNLDALAIAKTMAEVISKTDGEEIPEELDHALSSLRPSYRLSFSVSRLSTRLGEIVLNKRLKKFRTYCISLAILLVVNISVLIIGYSIFINN